MHVMSEYQNRSLSVAHRAATGTGRGISWLFRFFAKLSLIVIFIAAGLFVGGFLQFINVVTSYDHDVVIEKADAIVALTGGSTRIATALDVLARQKGKRLLISGVNQETKIEDLKSINPTNADLFDCCVDIETLALDTIGNAVETSKWMKTHQFSSLIVVTSAYHMPRSLVEFRKYLPDANLTPHPVRLEVLSEDGWWKNTRTLRFMLAEYVKYLAANLRDYVSSDDFDALRSGLWTRKVA